MELKNIVCMKMTVFWGVALCSLVEFYRHFRGSCCLLHLGLSPNPPEDSHLHIRRRENLKSPIFYVVCDTAFVTDVNPSILVINHKWPYIEQQLRSLNWNKVADSINVQTNDKDSTFPT
jgi:hypothetical protein